MSAPVPSRAVRRAVPFTLLPLALVACMLANAPWLRAFPAATIAIPLFGTALVSVLLPVVVFSIGVRPLWLTALIDVVAFVFFTMLVTLREPAGFVDLYRGLVHGPSQVLSYALPLVTPRTLLVPPVALCWIVGAVVGECLARAWQSLVPYFTVLVAFGLSYAATTRAITGPSDGRRYDTLLAGALLLTLLLLRAGRAWVEQDDDAVAAQPEGALPLRGLGIGIAVALVVAVAAGAIVQTSPFGGSPSTTARMPPVEHGAPVTPLAFVSGLRPDDPGSSGSPLFRLTVDRRASRYVALADVDTYDGDAWTFARRFRPSGGTVPADPDPAQRGTSAPVTQRYRIAAGPMTTVPWMPFLYRPQRVGGIGIDLDADSGMIVPDRRLRAGSTYQVRSSATANSFDRLGRTATPGTSTPPVYLQAPPQVRQSLTDVVAALRAETNTDAATPPVQFLQALQADLRSNYALAGGRTASRASSPAGSSASGPDRFAPGVFGSAPSPSSATPSGTSAAANGSGTGFATVLAAILGRSRTATPEQFATLVALVARQLGVPARVVTGFRLTGGGRSSTTVAPGTYDVRTGTAWTWVEIPIQGRGWVVLDAAPGRYSSAKSPPSASARPGSSGPTSTPNALVTQPAAGNPPAPRSPVPAEHGGPSATATTLIVVACVVGGLVLALALLFGRRRWRAARRRRAPDPRRRLVGAWQEGLDLLDESGLGDLSSLTSAEVANATHARFGAEPAARASQLGESANVALFDPGARIDPADADAAWHTQDELRRTVRRHLTLRERVSADVRYHRRRSHQTASPASWAAADTARHGPVETRPHRVRRRH